MRLAPLPWFALCTLVASALSVTSSAKAGVLYSNGFEANTTDWSASATRVSSGTNGVPSASGSFHATDPAGGGSFSRWGGYNFGAGNAVPTAFQPYTTSVDIYLNVSGGWANNTRFDFSSAINNAGGTHLRDFIFNAGFYDPTDVNGGPGVGTNRFVISASNNSQPGSAFAQNPANSPIAISTTGWYTFTHEFYDNGGVLAVDMSILDSTNTVVGSWTLSNPADLIGGVGGNRYGWFDYNQFPSLPFDNAGLSTPSAEPVPEPTSLAVFGTLALGGAFYGWRRRKSA